MSNTVNDKTNKKHKGNPNWVKGKSANPNGRPKDSFSIITQLKKELQKIPSGEKKTNLELLVARIIEEAIKKGNESQIKNILHYVEGLPKQSIKVEGDIKTALVEFIDDEETKKE